MSISSILPGCRRHLRTIRSSGTSRTPTSEAMITWSWSVMMKRAGAQAVAVQRRRRSGGHRGEGHGGRPVPRLHQGGVIFVESPPLGVHQRVAGPGLRDQHHPRMGQRIAAGQQQFEGVVEDRRCPTDRAGSAATSCRSGPRRSFSRRAPASVHPVHVAAHGVDLAVVGDEPVGVGQPPGREGVGREPLVHHRQRGLRQRVGQIFVEGPHLVRASNRPL